MKYKVTIIASLVLFLACISPGLDEVECRILPDSLGSVPIDTISKWNEFATSSVYPDIDPLLNQPVIELVNSIGGDIESLEVPVFFLPGYIAHSGDTLFVADISTEELISVNTSGELLWKTGAPGEGPGLFSGIGRLEVHNGEVYVCNNGNSRVDIFSMDGVYRHTISIIRPQDIISVNDSLIVILTRAETGGDCHLFSTKSDSFVHSFGAGNWAEIMQTSSSAGGLYGEMLSDSLLVYGAQDQSECYINNVYTGIKKAELSRIMPADPFKPETMENDGRTLSLWVPITGDLFISNDGTINVVFPTYMHDGTFMHPLEQDRNFAPVTIIDKYSHEGEYLYSWSLPDSLFGEVEMLDDGSILTRQLATATVFIYQTID